MFCLSPTHRTSRAVTLVVILAAVVSLAGCSQNPYLAAPGGAAWNMPQNAAITQNEARLAELNRRVQLLDDNNRQLTTQLAQSDQQVQVFKDESALLRNQLAAVTNQMESTAIAARDVQSQVRGMQASTQVRGGAAIQPNTNLTQLAGQLNLGGIPVQQDGETIRISVPSDQLFAPGTAQLTAQAASTLDPIASQLARMFPRNRIGIEGYADNAPLYGGGFASVHQLTAAQASAVLDLLSRRNGIPPTQLFTVAQGSNNPRQSNDTPIGRAANRRVELVIYPDNR